MKWSLDCTEPLNYYQFVTRFIVAFPDSKPIIKSHLAFSRENVDEIIGPLCGIVEDDKCRLTHARLSFLTDMIFRRKQLLEEVVEQQ